MNQRLVRGLDYYNRTVFEWVTTSLGSRGTVCAGGRYDGLVEQLGGRATHGVGFAMGLERLVLLVQAVNPEFKADPVVDIYTVASELTPSPQQCVWLNRYAMRYPALS